MTTATNEQRLAVDGGMPVRAVPMPPWPAFAEEAEDYRDFTAYRYAHHPAGRADERRAAWVRERLDEVALWQHAMWVREQHYAPWNLPRGLFRVS